MNKFLKGLLVVGLAVTTAPVKADTHHHTDLTTLTPRSQLINIPMAFTTFHELVGMKKDNRFGASFQVTPFYQASTEGKEIAKYFLVNDKNEIVLNTELPATAAATVQAKDDVNLYYIVHHYDATAVDTNITKLALDPDIESYGARIDYSQDLSKILKGLFFYASTAIVHTESDADLKVTSAATTLSNSDSSVKTILEKYFHGDKLNNTVSNAQEALKYGKISTDHDSSVTTNHDHDDLDETGLADIELGLGYKFLNKENYNASLALTFLIPTGEENHPEWMLAPVIGAGNHFGLGGNLCAMAKVWGDADKNLKLHLKLKYLYLFEDSETRTFNIKDIKWSRYYNLIKKTAAGAKPTLTPAANVTTLKCDVEPGSLLNGILALSYSNGGFTFDLGYDMYFRETESVKQKELITAETWAIAARNLNVDTALTSGWDGKTVTANVAETLVNDAALDIHSAETPSQFVNGIFGGLGYTFKNWEYPLMLGLGGKYEWASDRSAFDQWSISGKIGVGF